MANAMYAKGLEAFLTGQINWASDTIKAVLVDTLTYTPNLATHQFLSDIPEAARVATSPSLDLKSAANGVADAADVTFSAVSGNQSEALVIFKSTGVDASSRLICYIDTATGLPITPGGGDITVVWDNGANKIFRL